MDEVTVKKAKGTAAGRRASTREKIVRAAADLLAERGREAVTTRAVAAAAGVQAPTIYRLFGDMRGLLDEVASYGWSTYLRDKTIQETKDDPVEDLRRGWDLHVGFGLANPAFYALMFGDPRPGEEPAAALESFGRLHTLVQGIAESGRLRVSVERGAAMIHAATMGVVLSLLAAEPEDRDPGLSEATREAMLAAVITDGSDEEATGGDGRGRAADRAANRAVALKAVLADASDELTPGERALLSEWLDRIADPAR